MKRGALYSIQFLHQITTVRIIMDVTYKLYSIQFLHQITTEIDPFCRKVRCIVSNFYIKSQLIGRLAVISIVV